MKFRLRAGRKTPSLEEVFEQQYQRWQTADGHGRRNILASLGNADGVMFLCGRATGESGETARSILEQVHRAHEDVSGKWVFRLLNHRDPKVRDGALTAYADFVRFSLENDNAFRQVTDDLKFAPDELARSAASTAVRMTLDDGKTMIPADKRRVLEGFRTPPEKPAL